MRRPILLAVLALGFAGCASSTQRVDTVSTTSAPSSRTWSPASDSQRTAEPDQIYLRGDPARPATRPDALTKQQVLNMMTGKDPADAIAEIDRHPFAFPLNGENLGWFEDRVAPPELIDYLKKRAAVNWEQLSQGASPAPAPAPSGGFGYANTAPDAGTPPPTTVYSDPQPTQTTVIYQDPYYDPYYYGYGGVYVYGGYAYGPYRRYYGPGVVGAAPVYRPGVAAGLYAGPTVRANVVVRGGGGRGGHGGGHR